MTTLLRFEDLQAIFHQHRAHVPDHRHASPNTRSTIQDAVFGALGMFCTQSPSFVAYERRLQHTTGHHNAQTLCGVEKMPCDQQMRTRLAPIAPHHFAPVLLEVFARLAQPHLRDSFRVLGNQRLVALEGTTSGSSQALSWPNGLRRPLANGHTR